MYDEILKARERIRGRVRETPMLPSTVLSDIVGAPVILKCENLQRTGSFKARGAMNMLGTLDPSQAVVTASAGNHAQGVALAASEHGIRSTVVMPRSAPIAKQRATSGYGAQIELVDGSLADAIERAQEMATTSGLVFVPPYDHPLIVAGQGTLGLEVLEQEPEVECVLVPAGGGGLLAGVAAAVKAMRPDVRVVGVQTAAMPGVACSLEAGAPQAVPAVRSLADGAAVSGPSALTLDLIQRHVDEVVTVTEEAIAQAIVLLMERSRLVVEGAGALTTAAILCGAVIPAGHTVCVVSGGNIDLNVLGRVAARGLVLAGRHRTLTVAAANTPGELARITSAIAAAGANVLEVQHELVTADLPVSVARITFRLELAGPAAFDRLMADLVEAGLVRGTMTDLSTPAAAATPH